MKTKNRNPRDIGFYFLILIILISAIYLLAVQGDPTTAPVEYSDLRRLFMNEEVQSFKIKDGKVTAELKTSYTYNGGEYQLVEHQLLDVGIFYEDFKDHIDGQMERDPNFKYNYEASMRMPWWASLIPYVIIIAVFFVVWNTMVNRSGVGGDKGAMKFGKARTRLAGDDKKKVTFSDVAGADEEKAELQEIIDFLKGPQKYISLGARIDRKSTRLNSSHT